jgi:hypothetical protein
VFGDSKKNLWVFSSIEIEEFGDKFIAKISKHSSIEERFLQLKIEEGFLQSKAQVEVLGSTWGLIFIKRRSRVQRIEVLDQKQKLKTQKLLEDPASEG